MLWYAQIVLYIIGFFISFITLSNIEWTKMIRRSKPEFLWLVYTVFSLVLGFLLGFMMVTIGSIFLKI